MQEDSLYSFSIYVHFVGNHTFCNIFIYHPKVPLKFKNLRKFDFSYFISKHLFHARLFFRFLNFIYDVWKFLSFGLCNYSKAIIDWGWQLSFYVRFPLVLLSKLLNFFFLHYLDFKCSSFYFFTSSFQPFEISSR